MDDAWEDWDTNFEIGTKLLDDAGIVDTDVAREARMAGEVCLKNGETTRGLLALKLSHSHFERMEREEEAAILQDLIEEVQASF